MIQLKAIFNYYLLNTTMDLGYTIIKTNIYNM